MPLSLRRLRALTLGLVVAPLVTPVVIAATADSAVAAPCEVFVGGVRVTRDPCPALPSPVCTTFADGGLVCQRWLLFSPNGATQDIRECDSDEYGYAVSTTVAANPAAAGPFCFGPKPSGIEPQAVTPIRTGVPADASAVLANLTMVDGSGWGYVTADRCSGMQAAPQAKSNGNHDQFVALANLAVAAVDPDGHFCLYNSRRVNLAVDTQGYFAPPAAGGQLFVPSTQRRLLDTRTTVTGAPSGGSVTRVETGVASGATAVLVNITMVDGGHPGYVTAASCSAMTPGPQSRSNGNFPVSTAVANLSVVPVDPDGAFCLYNNVAVNLVVDLQGSFAAAAATGAATGLGFDAVTPRRLLDTRAASTIRVFSGTITRVETGAPTGTAAVLVNLAMTDALAPGYITADKCSVLTAGAQTKSNGNHPRGTPISNLSVVPVDADGAFCIYNHVATYLVVDLQGSFSRTAGQRFFLLASSRVFDSRR